MKYVAYHAYRPSTVRMHTYRDGLSVRFDYPSQLIPTLVVFGDLLEPELAMLDGSLGPGHLAVDIGASIGTWTLKAALTGADVLAVEPDADNIATLRRNVADNRAAERVSVIEAALGDGNGRADLVRSPRRYLNRVEPGGEAGAVQLSTLETFFADRDLDFVDVVKVNTAGNEAAVLRGALELFRRHRIGLALVLDGLAVRPILDQIHGFGYEIGVYDGAAGAFVPVESTAELEQVSAGPMNHYVVLRSTARPGGSPPP